MGDYSPNIIADSFISCATHNADGEYIIFGDRRIKWREFVPRVFKVAHTLLSLGVKRGEHVALMLHNTPEFLEINFGIQVAGAVPAPMNYRFTPREIEYQGNHCDASVFLYDSIWAEAVEAAAPALEKTKHFVRLGEGGAKEVLDYEQLLGDAKDTDPMVANEWKDVAVMIYTGGTTGFPKGVMLTYQAHLDMFARLFAALVIRALTSNVKSKRHQRIVEALPLPAPSILGPILRTRFVQKWLEGPAAEERITQRAYETFSDTNAARKGYKRARKAAYPSLPLFHDAAYANLMMGALTGAMILVLPDSVRFDPALVLNLVEKEKITNLTNVPTGWKKLVTWPEAGRYDLSSVRMSGTGGGVCPAQLKKEILRLFPNTMILDAFGQTEMTPVTSIRVDMEEDTIQDRSVGRSIVEVRVVDENGKDLPQGEVGEILYRSNTVMKGYYKDDDKTREVMEDGWFRSGDLGCLDENGEIRVADRKKECINTGGEKVFPLEVEEVIAKHAKVEDVCVIGVPDEEWGTSVRAVIQLKKNQQAETKELLDFCRGELAGYKIPRSVVFVEELPRSPVGKMLREKVREIYGRPEPDTTHLL
jgi:acyl-CoA synthetase (AMP-forming)/AMP-acid ligase II